MEQDAILNADKVPDEASLPNDSGTLKKMVIILIMRGLEHKEYRERTEAFLRKLFGPRQERFNPNQPGLFDDLPEEILVELAATASGEEVADEAEELPARRAGKKKGHGRQPILENLRRVRVEHDLPEADKACPCCQQMRTKIGEETSEQIDYEPASVFVRQHVRFKYACLQCLAAKPTDGALPDNATPAQELDTPTPLEVEPVPADHAESPAAAPSEAPTKSETIPVSSLIVTAPKPPQPIDKGLPGPGMLAYVVTSKYADHLPLHRLEGILARHGLKLSRKTMCDWMASMARLVEPLTQLMLCLIRRSSVIQIDETRLPVQDQAGQVKSGRIWLVRGDRNYPYQFYEYRPDKKRDGPEELLRGYRGFLQADAANVFDALYVPGQMTEVGCWAHARRHYIDAQLSDTARSAQALARIQQFYALEERATALIARKELTGDAADALRLQMRQEQTRPLLESFREWIVKEQSQLLLKSPMAVAVQYSLNHWEALCRFTEQGFLKIDNNAAENGLRSVALGRKNYLFAGSDVGGKTAARLYTLTQTCRVLKIDPYKYLCDLFTRLPATPRDQLSQFLPDRWAAQQAASTK